MLNLNRRPPQDAEPQHSHPNTAGRSYKVQTDPSNDRMTPQDTFPVPLKGVFAVDELLT